MQLVSARIWTRVTVSISYDDNHYTKGTSNNKRLNPEDLISLIYLLTQKFIDGNKCAVKFHYSILWIFYKFLLE